MQAKDFSAILFYSSNYAIWASKLLQKNSIPEKLISVPRQVSSDCGYCVRIEPTDTEKVKKLMHDNGVEFDKIVGL